MTVTKLTDNCQRFDVTELTVTELTCHRYGLSPIWLAPNFPNRYSWRVEGLWRIRRHGPVIAQCTDSVVFPAH